MTTCWTTCGILPAPAQMVARCCATMASRAGWIPFREVPEPLLFCRCVTFVSHIGRIPAVTLLVGLVSHCGATMASHNSGIWLPGADARPSLALVLLPVEDFVD